jgi:hypothetical protein
MHANFSPSALIPTIKHRYRHITPVRDQFCRMNSGILRVRQVIVLVLAEKGSFASMPSMVGALSFLAMFCDGVSFVFMARIFEMYTAYQAVPYWTFLCRMNVNYHL